jgi:ankyrin repeat protein
MVRRTLDELPKDLPETYDRILRNIDRSRAAMVAKEILRWLVHAQRQLTTSELLEVTGFPIQEGPRFDKEAVLGDLDDILRICSSLVSVTTSEGETGSQSNDRSGRHAAFAPEYIRLAHASVREYLVSDSLCLAQYSLHDQESHDILASCCLIYLLRFEADEWTTEDFESIFPLARYAAEFWTKHARISGGWSQRLRDLSVEILTQRKVAFRAWSRLGHRMLIQELPLLAASSEGLSYAVRILLQKDSTKINAWVDDSMGSRSALSEASAGGHEEIVEMLLHKGANVNTPSGWHDADALSIACKEGHDGIAIRLLNKGASPYAEQGHRETALAIACSRGRDNVVERMLATDVPMDSHRKVGRALFFGCAHGHDRIVSTLAHKNALVGVPGEDVDSAMAIAIERAHYRAMETLFDVDRIQWRAPAALCAACHQGDEKLVQRLLDKADFADVTPFELNKGLCKAFAEGHEGTVELLLARGASAGDDTLRFACTEGNEKISRMLLCRRYSADSDALIAACAEGQGRAMKVLLARGARANQLAFPGALHYACCGGFFETVKVLLKIDCGLAFLGEGGGESLQMACAGGHQGIVETLLANGVSADYTGETHGNTLTIACERGDVKIVKMLLDEGASVEGGGVYRSDSSTLTKRRYGTPLQTACEGGHIRIVEMLLDKGAMVDSHGGYYDYPLHAACTRGYMNIVDMLLNYGADVNALGSSGRFRDYFCYVDCLTIACERGYKETVGMLLSRGANVNNHSGSFPGSGIYNIPIGWLTDPNALVTACERGHEGIVRKILLNRAKVGVKEGANGSALFAACAGGYEEIVEMLLNKDAQTAINDVYNDAIQAASDAGFEEIVKILLDRATSGSTTTASGANATSDHATSTQNQSGGAFSRPGGSNLFRSPSHSYFGSSTRRDSNEGLFGDKTCEASLESATAFHSNLNPPASFSRFRKSNIEFQPYKQPSYFGFLEIECFQSITALPLFRNRSFEVRESLWV